MGNYLQKPQTKKFTHEGTGNGLKYCVSSMQGWRSNMEDEHAVHCGLPEPYAAWNYFGVFDGHAGKQVAQYASTHLLNCILETKEFESSKYREGIRAGFLQMDNDMHNNQLDTNSGSTAITLFTTPDKLYFANCGDSRGLLSRKGSVVFATQDHEPTLPKEELRIVNAGGHILADRVNGNLAMSRALGDFDFKCNVQRAPLEQLISPEPDVTELVITDDDEFVVLACDGVWDVMGNKELCAYIHSRLIVTHDLKCIVHDVLDMCLRLGSRDNITMMLIMLPGAPKINALAVSLDTETDDYIRLKTIELAKRLKIYDMDEMISIMNEELKDLQHLRGALRIQGKYHVIQRGFKDAHSNKPNMFFNYFPHYNEFN